MTTRESILQAADRLFGELGVDATTTRDIADACGVNKALIHYHFQGKDALFGVLLDRYYDALDEAVGRALEGAPDPRVGLHRVMDSYVDFLAHHRSFSRMAQRESSGGRHVARIAGRTVPLFDRGVKLLRSRFPATRSGDLEASQLLLSFYGMVVGYFAQAPVVEGLAGADPLAPAALARRKRHLHRMVDLTLDAVELETRHGQEPKQNHRPRRGTS